MSTPFWSFVTISGLISVVIMLTTTTNALAHGNTKEIFRAKEGSYEVIVRTLPKEPVVGTVHFSITPMDASVNQIVSDAQILIVSNNNEGKPTYQARALNTPDSPRYYDANITFKSSGQWTLIIKIQNNRLGEVTFTVPLNVSDQAIGPGNSGTVVFLVLLVILVGGSLYVWRSARRHKTSSE